MKRDSQLRVLLLLRYLYKHSSEEHPVSVVDILQFWESKGIHTDRKSVYGDIAVLRDFNLDIVQRRERQNLYFIGSRLFELPELKLLVDAVGASHFITKKKVQICSANCQPSPAGKKLRSWTGPYTWTAQPSRTTRESIIQWTRFTPQSKGKTRSRSSA